MQDQTALWQRNYQEKTEPRWVSHFAKVVLPYLKPSATVLELGCGTGANAAYFAKHGMLVTATDVAASIIEQNKQHFRMCNNLTFQVVDISQPLPFADKTFDAVYANLSLHYFMDVATRRIFAELYRILRLQGLVAFACKSVKDPLFGKGEFVETNMYELDGHVRHFFTEAYTKALLGTMLQPIVLASKSSWRHKQPINVINVIARKV